MNDVMIHVRISPGLLRWGLAGGLLSFMAVELASENVTLTTYYPAPSGIYAKMITTNNTYLARDGGNVGIGTTNPLAKLEVSGSGATGGIAINNSGTPFIDFGSGGSKGRIEVNSSGTSMRFYVGGAGASFERMYITSDGRIGTSHTGTSYVPPTGKFTNMGLSVTGAIRSMQSDCVVQTFSHGGAGEICAGGRFATNMTGFYAEYVFFGMGVTRVPASVGGSTEESTLGTSAMLCCLCGTNCDP